MTDAHYKDFIICCVNKDLGMLLLTKIRTCMFNWLSI